MPAGIVVHEAEVGRVGVLAGVGVVGGEGAGGVADFTPGFVELGGGRGGVGAVGEAGGAEMVAEQVGKVRRAGADARSHGEAAACVVIFDHGTLTAAPFEVATDEGGGA